mgnify:CR=1 FL=1
MRTNIVLDDKLVKEAFKFTKVKTKRELIDCVLKEFIENHQRRDIRKLRGKVKLAPDYDYKTMRAENN